LKKYLTIAFFFFSSWAIAQESFLLWGKILDADTQTPLEYTHILSLKTKKGSISDKNGYFFISSKKGDYIKFSFMGYHNIYKMIKKESNDTLVFYLHPQIMALNSIDVYPWTKEEFKYKFVHDTILPDAVDRLKKRILVPVDELKFLSIPKGKGFIIPLNFKSSKEKQIEILNKIKAVIKAEKRYRALIYQVTKLKDSEQNNFIQFCNFTNRYIKYARDYYLILAIKNKWEDYKKQYKKN